MEQPISVAEVIEKARDRLRSFGTRNDKLRPNTDQ
jgi:hypothetical protein